MSLKKKFFEFALWLTVLILFLLVIYQLIYIFRPEIPQPNYILYIFLVPYVINLVVYLLILKGMTLDAQHFVQIIILSIVVRLLFYGAFNFAMIYFSPDTAISNVVSFFVIYLCSTALEISMLVPLINRKHNSEQNQSQST